MLSAVLDMDEVELFLSGRHHSAISKEQLIMPGAQEVTSQSITAAQDMLGVRTQ